MLAVSCIPCPYVVVSRAKAAKHVLFDESFSAQYHNTNEYDGTQAAGLQKNEDDRKRGRVIIPESSLALHHSCVVRTANSYIPTLL